MRAVAVPLVAGSGAVGDVPGSTRTTSPALTMELAVAIEVGLPGAPDPVPDGLTSMMLAWAAPAKRSAIKPGSRGLARENRIGRWISDLNSSRAGDTAREQLLCLGGLRRGGRKSSQSNGPS